MNRLWNYLKSHQKFYLTVLVVIAVLVLLAFASFLILANYLKNNTYPEPEPNLSLIFYEDAQTALDKTWLSFPAKALLAAVDWLNPDYFLHYSDFTPENRLYYFDISKEPATFQVIGVNPLDRSLNLRYVYPSILSDKLTTAKLGCSRETTSVIKAETSVSGKNPEQLDQAKTTRPDRDVFEFIWNLLNQPETNSLQLAGVCQDNSDACRLITDQCTVVIN